MSKGIKKMNAMWKKAIKNHTNSPNGTWTEQANQESIKQDKYERRWNENHKNVDALQMRLPGSYESKRSK